MLLIYIYGSSALPSRPWNYASGCSFIMSIIAHRCFGMNSMGWLSLTYVSDPIIIFLTSTDDI
jgi:hypothetical protein